MFLFDHHGNHRASYSIGNSEEIQFRRVFPQNKAPCRLIVIDIFDNEMFIEFDGKNAKSKKRPSKIPRESRKTEIKAVFSSPVQLTEIRVPKFGVIQFVGRPSSILELRDSLLIPSEVDLTCYYERGAKRKVISAIFLNDDSSALNANVALDRYDHFYACDANTWNFSETGKVSACVVFRGWLTASPDHQRRANFSRECMIKIEGETGGNPELYAARALIIELQQRIPVVSAKPIGIVMDSELGRLKDINARRLPLVEDFFLPAGFEIMYASDATGSTEFFANMLIRMCDKASTEALLTHEKENGLTRIAVPAV